MPVDVPGVELVGDILEELEPDTFAPRDEDVAPGRAIQDLSQSAVGADEDLQTGVAQQDRLALRMDLDGR